MLFFLIIGVLVGAAGVIFALQNVATITVTFFFWHLTGSLAVVLVCAMATGLLVGMLIIIPELVKDNFRFMEARRRVKKLEEELEKTKKAAGAAVTELEKKDAILNASQIPPSPLI